MTGNRRKPTCGFCQKRGHTQRGCQRLKDIVKSIRDQVHREMKWDIVKQLSHKVAVMMGDMEFIRNENERLAEENALLWVFVTPLLMEKNLP